MVVPLEGTRTREPAHVASTRSTTRKQTAGNAGPGQCTAPASEHMGEPGCYLSAEVDIEAPGGELYWRIYSLPTLIDARGAATHAGRAVAAEVHGKAWLHVMGTPSLVSSANKPRHHRTQQGVERALRQMSACRQKRTRRLAQNCVHQRMVYL